MANQAVLQVNKISAFTTDFALLATKHFYFLWEKTGGITDETILKLEI